MNYKEENWYNDIIDRLLSHKDMHQDQFYDLLHEEIDNMVIYNSDSHRIVDDLNYDVFQEDDLFGKAENWGQAAYAAIYQNFYENGPSFEEFAANELIPQ